MMSTLQARLRNCIQTILDLAPSISARNGMLFEAEFVSLKKYLDCVEKMELGEEDVAQMEKATSEFLDDMRGLRVDGPPGGRLQ